MPLEGFRCSGVRSIPVALVPKDDGSIKINNPGPVRAALQAATSLYEAITELHSVSSGLYKRFGSWCGLLLVSSVQDTRLLNLLLLNCQKSVLLAGAFNSHHVSWGFRTDFCGS
ncbi:uncharacterized protein LOC144135162 [Amblyomma americanum]